MLSLLHVFINVLSGALLRTSEIEKSSWTWRIDSIHFPTNAETCTPILLFLLFLLIVLKTPYIHLIILYRKIFHIVQLTSRYQLHTGQKRQIGVTWADFYHSASSTFYARLNWFAPCSNWPLGCARRKNVRQKIINCVGGCTIDDRRHGDNNFLCGNSSPSSHVGLARTSHFYVPCPWGNWNPRVVTFPVRLDK